MHALSGDSKGRVFISLFVHLPPPLSISFYGGQKIRKIYNPFVYEISSGVSDEGRKVLNQGLNYSWVCVCEYVCACVCCSEMACKL